MEFKKLQKRIELLSHLIDVVEENESDIAKSILKKAVRAYNKPVKEFTGIIRLTSAEKDFLSYYMECEHISPYCVEAVKHFAKLA